MAAVRGMPEALRGKRVMPGTGEPRQARGFPVRAPIAASAETVPASPFRMDMAEDAGKD